MSKNAEIKSNFYPGKSSFSAISKQNIVFNYRTFRMSRRRCEMYCGHMRLCVCPRPHAYTIAWTRMTPSCALLGGFAVGARVAFLWQHNANAQC